MEKGNFEGYVRELTASGECQVGFWKTINVQSKFSKNESNRQMAVPWGKWASYLPDGSFRVKQDYYIGRQVKNQPSQIEVVVVTPKTEEKNLVLREKQLVFTNYLENVDMSSYKVAQQQVRSSWFGCCQSLPDMQLLK